jgi:hypothetical protein
VSNTDLRHDGDSHGILDLLDHVRVRRTGNTSVDDECRGSVPTP